MSSGENVIMAIGALIVAMSVFSGMFGFISNSDDAKDCELEWVDCTDDDKIGECEEQYEEIVTGPYWNETIEIKTTIRKQVCKD